jgi:nitrogen regulatory protein PII-like uncharacterized protein
LHWTTTATGGGGGWLEPMDGGGIDTVSYFLSELIELSPDEIKDFSLDELSSDDIERILTFLSDEDLDKVLYNIHPDILRIMLDKISPNVTNLILERVNPSTEARISNLTDIS